MSPRSASSLSDSAADSAVADLVERDRIVSRVTELFLATDRRDWAAVERQFTPEVHFDMSSVGGGPAATVHYRLPS